MKRIVIGIGGQSNAAMRIEAGWNRPRNLSVTWNGTAFNGSSVQTLGALIGARFASANPHSEVHVSIAAKGGLPISHWLDGDMWRETCAAMSEPLTALFWFQGEADAAQRNPHYAENFNCLYERLRRQPWFKDAPFFMFGITTHSAPVYARFNDTLRSLEGPGRYFIDTSGIGVDGWSDKLHLNAEGQSQAADLAYAAWEDCYLIS